MISCEVMGGLGNMLFHVAAVYALARDNDDQLSLPNLDSHLVYLNSRRSLCSGMEDAQEYKVIFRGFPSSLEEPPVHYQSMSFHYEPLVYQSRCQYKGFCQSEKYFLHHRKEILSWFSFSDCTTVGQEKFQIGTTETIGVHVRRADYLGQQDYHPVQTKQYYEDALDCLPKEARVLFFSDDLEWCKEQFRGGRFYFVERKRDYLELLLMSQCTHQVISNSTFGWWGAWLNKDPVKLVVAPSHWFGPQLAHFTTRDLIPERWTVI